jgi:hypothetical protein
MLQQRSRKHQSLEHTARALCRIDRNVCSGVRLSHSAMSAQCPVCPKADMTCSLRTNSHRRLFPLHGHRVSNVRVVVLQLDVRARRERVSPPPAGAARLRFLPRDMAPWANMAGADHRACPQRKPMTALRRGVGSRAQLALGPRNRSVPLDAGWSSSLSSIKEGTVPSFIFLPRFEDE